MSHRVRAVNEYAAAIDAEGESAYHALERWAAGHANPESRLEVLPFDPDKYPFQKLEVVALEPEPSLDLARQLAEAGAGAAGYNKLVRDFQRAGLLRTILANAKKGTSTLITTPHLKDTLDTAITHNAFFVASEDEAVAENNVLVANHMMKFLKIGGIAVPQVLVKSGRVVFGWPHSASQHGVPAAITQAGNKVFAQEFSELIGRGAVVHRALTDTRAGNAVAPDGSIIKIMPRVEASITQIARKRTPQAVGVAMNTEADRAIARVLPLRRLETDEDVHALMGQLALATGELAGLSVVYEAATEAQEVGV